MEDGQVALRLLPPGGGEPHGAAGGGAVRVHVVGEDPLARAGIRALLDGSPAVEVAGESEPGPWTAAALHRSRPDVLVAHGELSERQRARLARAVGGSVPVLTLGGRRPQPGGQSGPGHLPGTATSGELAAAVVLAAAGYTVVRRGRLPAPAARPGPVRRVSQVGPEALTERECQVLRLLAEGLSNGEIAEALTVSEHTVKTHVQNLLHKLGLRSRVHAAIYAFESGLRGPED